MQSVDQEKRALRRLALAQRDGLAPEYRADRSAEICEQLKTALDRMLSDGLCKAPVVAVYSAMGSEVDPAAFARYAEGRGATVAFPCMLPKSGGATGIQHDEVSARRSAASAQRMCMRAASLNMAVKAPFIAHPTRPFAIDDPKCARFPLVLPSEIDLIVVPLVAFDARAMRLGYGGGCYDRYLPELRPDCQVIGIAFNEQRLARIPAGPHDRALPRTISA